MVCTASRDVFSPSRSQNNLPCFLVRVSDCGHTPASDRLDRLCLGLQARGLGWRAVLSGKAGAAPWSPRVLGLGGAADAPFPSATLELERLTGLRSHSRRLQAPGSSVVATIQCSSPLWVSHFPQRPQLETSVSEAQPHGWGRRCTTVGTGSPRRRRAPSGFPVALGTPCPRRGAGTLQRELRPTWRISTAASRPPAPSGCLDPYGEDREVREGALLILGLELPSRQHRPARLAPPTGVYRGAKRGTRA